MSYTFDRTIDMPFDAAIEHVTEALKAKGFGVLTTINVKDTLKKKLDADFRPYVILGACNPPLAFQALSQERNIGAMLPCNVIVQAVNDDGSGGVMVSAIDPVASMAAVDNPALGEIATRVQGMLRDLVESL
ncbi:MAG: DUF302 domain-containing protein [Hyphomicrobiales bacterium]|nr:DUF302 domain-containing protein [Hyphomicrobiales bacterium]MCP5374269.1 DUF302 domain-containing protein [Hyphomicrobiales bacterium]